MESAIYSGDPNRPYPERMLRHGGRAMVIDLGGSHRMGYPDLWVSAQGKPLSQKAQKALLEVLAKARAVRPQNHIFLYCDAYGDPGEGIWYIMRSKDGRRFTALSWNDSWEGIVSEVRMMIDHHDRAPADDPREAALAKLMGFEPLDS